MSQLSLFDNEQVKISISRITGIEKVICAAMNKAAEESLFSREQILERMNDLARSAGIRLTGGNAKSISIHTLEKWLNPNADHIPSLRAIEVFMQACQSFEPLDAWLREHDLKLMDDEAKLYHDYGKSRILQEKASKKARNLKSKLEDSLK